MQRARKQRITLIVFLIGGIGIVVGLVLFALRQNVDWFYTPTQVVQGQAPQYHKIRVGGLVVKGSLKREPGSLLVRFVLTDQVSEIKVEYTGLLPDLFREGQGIIAIGQVEENNKVVATQVLAKHDENYMPPEIANMGYSSSGMHHEANF